ncbi:hypothetical protein [Bdellovibrio sp. HCB337]|uniref:hypothetical protein n=1 Tax=Bdellovibrio sp. HCB337 TaxID=3394358 RepID=UPI0039A45470
MKLLKWLVFYFSKLSVIPHGKAYQKQVMEMARTRHSGVSPLLKNSLCQHDCHSRYFLRRVWFLYNLASIFLLPVLMGVLLLRKSKDAKNPIANISLTGRFPEEVKKDFSPTYVKMPFGSLRARDYKYLRAILLNSGFRPYFILRTVWKLGVYSDLVEIYSPSNVLVTQEMTFESSFLTQYLRDLGICHVNYMHGEKWFSMQDAFSSFEIAYVWEEFYKKLFEELGSDTKEYRFFKAIHPLPEPVTQLDAITYYHQLSSSPKEFTAVLQNLEKFAHSHKCELLVRLHPLQTKDYEVQMLRDRNIQQENVREVSLEKSVTRCRYVCSESSSVLYQGSLLGKTLVVDNTFPERIDIYRDLDFIVLKKIEHIYLV